MRPGAEEFDKKRKKLGKLYDDNCVYQKLSKKVTDFKDSIPLIQQLKGSSLTDRLWNKLV
jgi:dynein heavy chain, axonemal